MWTVYLTGSVANARAAELIYGVKFFPHEYHYKRDAIYTVEKLTEIGVLSDVMKTKDFEVMIDALRDTIPN